MFIDQFDKHWLPRSAIEPKYPEKYLTNLLNEIQPKTILEIGTFNGITSAFFASFPFVKKVITIDITDNRKELCYKVWRKVGVMDKIEYCLVKDNKYKERVIKTHSFDFAFIDGDHTFEGVKLDFELVKDKCDNILFHDFGLNPYVTKFINSLGSKVIHKRYDVGFALWKK